MLQFLEPLIQSHKGLSRDTRSMARLIQSWRTQTVAIMDEVDMLLHPLRSELNFPYGTVQELDLNADRWDLVLHLLHLFWRVQLGWLTSTPAPQRTVLQTLKQILEEGAASHMVQLKPHLQVLDPDRPQSA